MNQYEIPKEIKTKPKLLGLDIKEMAVVIILLILIMTFFKDMVHGWFVIPYFIVSIGFLFYMIAPSSNNPQKKNYHSILLFLKRDKKTYHALDVHEAENDELILFVEKENEKNFRKLQTFTVQEETVTESEEINDDEEDLLVVPFESTDENETQVNSKVNNLQDEEIVHSSFTKEKIEEEVTINTKNENSTVASVEQIRSPIASNKNRLSKETIPNSSEYEESKDGKRGGFMKKKFLRYFVVASVIVAILVVGTITGYYFQQQSPIRANDVQEEEVLVQAIRSASLKDYEKAATHFDSVDYESLSNDDKDVMLLSYLFSDQPEKALELEPSFDEAIVSYYKTNLSMEKIRTLSETFDSKVFAFEIAVDDKDYWKIIELKESVKMKGTRGENVVEAYIELGNIEGAKKIAEELQDPNLIQRVKEIQEQLERKEKDSEKEDETDAPKNEIEKKENKKESGLT